MLIVSTFATPVGFLQVKHDEHYIFQSFFTKEKSQLADHPFTERIVRELASYFSEPDYRFQLPLKPQGSTHQLKVLHALLTIPAGRTVTYGELAASLQSSPRAVGQACKRNPLALFIPCHRVVGKNNYGGYMGDPAALSYKLDLLQHENIAITHFV